MMTITQRWYGRGLYLLGRYYWMKGTQKNSDIHVTDLSAALAIWETAAGMGNGKALEQMSEIYCYGIERYTENGHVADAMKQYEKNEENEKNKDYSNRYAELAAYVYEEAHAYTILARNENEKEAKNENEERVKRQKILDYIKLAIENEDLYAWCLYAKPLLGLKGEDFEFALKEWSVDEYKEDLENLNLDDFTKYIKAIGDNSGSNNPSDYTETPINGYAMAHIGDIYKKEGNESSMLSSYKESVKKGCELGTVIE